MATEKKAAVKKKKPPAGSDVPSRFDELMGSDLVSKIKRRFGSAIVRPASKFEESPLRLSSGVFFVDYGLGGGWPMGRWNIIYGDKSSGKTGLCLKTIASAQRSCARCWSPAPNGECMGCGEYREPVIAYIDVEGTWDTTWAAAMGVDPNRLLLSEPEYQEQTLDIAENLMRSDMVDLLFIDSLAFLTPQKEIEESTGKALQAEQARVLGRGVRKIVAAQNYVGNTKGRRPTIICTNQLRMKIGVMFGDPHVQSGGKAPGFAATTEVKCWSGAKSDQLIDEATGKLVYIDLHFKVEKNKSAAAKYEGVWRLMTSDTELKKKGDVAEESELVEKGLLVGLVTKVSSQRLECLGEGFRSKSVIQHRLMTDLDYQETYKGELLKRLQG
jgi:recombination protein RecA